MQLIYIVYIDRLMSYKFNFCAVLSSCSSPMPAVVAESISHLSVVIVYYIL